MKALLKIQGFWLLITFGQSKETKMAVGASMFFVYNFGGKFWFFKSEQPAIWGCFFPLCYEGFLGAAKNAKKSIKTREI